MPAWIVALLNPLNWLKVASAIKSITGAINFLIDQVRKRRAEKLKDQIDKANEELKKANEIQDDSARMKAKADAMCKLEKANDPNSTCDQ